MNESFQMKNYLLEILNSTSQSLLDKYCSLDNDPIPNSLAHIHDLDVDIEKQDVPKVTDPTPIVILLN